jgi:hypothetical protein
VREGTAAYINFVVTKKTKFAYTGYQVKECISVGLTPKFAVAAGLKKANDACHCLLGYTSWWRWTVVE